MTARMHMACSLAFRAAAALTATFVAGDAPAQDRPAWVSTLEDMRSRVANCSATPNSPETRFAGTYGEDHNPMIVCHTEGRLYALIEWMFLYPLEAASDSVFTFPSYAMYGHEQLRFLQDRDRVTAVVLGVGAAGIRFVRR